SDETGGAHGDEAGLSVHDPAKHGWTGDATPMPLDAVRGLEDALSGANSHVSAERVGDSSQDRSRRSLPLLPGNAITRSRHGAAVPDREEAGITVGDSPEEIRACVLVAVAAGTCAALAPRRDPVGHRWHGFARASVARPRQGEEGGADSADKRATIHESCRY